MASAPTPEMWYIRLPDGRVLRVRTAEALRRFLKSGRIPWDSRVRSSPDDAWQPLDATPEFADLVPKEQATPEEKPVDQPAANEASPPPSTPELRTLGLRGLVEELFNAFESTLQRPKLITAGLTGLGMGVTLVIANLVQTIIPTDLAWVGHLGAALVLLILFNTCTSIIGQLTALELSRYRPAHFSELPPGLILFVVRLTCAMSLIGGAMAGLTIGLRSLPRWIGGSGAGIETIVNITNGASLILEAICWPIVGYATLMMGPIYIVEDYSIWRGLYEWLGMLRQHLGRIYLYQAIAFTFAAVMAFPVVLPILLAFGLAGGDPRTLSLGESVPFYLLIGAALTPMLAYLLVAHVFIYLNLRYEFFYSARDK